VDQPAAGNAAVASERNNVPLSSRENKFIADADYEIAPRTFLRGIWEHRQVDFTNADVSGYREDKLALEMRRPVMEEFTGAIRLAHNQRRGSDYDKNQFFEKSYSPARVTGSRFDNNPQMRNLLYGDYDENRLRLNGNWIASETVSVQGNVDWFGQRHKGPNCSGVASNANVAAVTTSWRDECLGRIGADGMMWNVDAQWQPEENLTTFLFYTLNDYSMNQNGRSTTSGAASSSTNTTFKIETNNRDHTLGLGVKWQPHEHWDVGGQYLLNKATGETYITAAGAAKPPNTASRLHSLQAFAKWNYSKQLTWRFNYIYENLKALDWAYDGISPTAAATRVLLTGQDMPKYSNHVIGVSAAIHNW
jgi:hypothetical protein